MFTKKFKGLSRPISFAHEPCLINKMFKYKSLGEMVAMARATGVAPVPTRNGVYTGEQVIPRDTFEKLNVQRQLMDSYDQAERQLKDAETKLAKEAKERELAEYKAKVIKEYQSSQNKGE